MARMGALARQDHRTEGCRSLAGDLALRDAPSGTECLTMSGLAQRAIVWLAVLLKKRLSGGHAARNMKFTRMAKPSKAMKIFCRRVNPFSKRL